MLRAAACLVIGVGLTAGKCPDGLEPVKPGDGSLCKDPLTGIPLCKTALAARNNKINQCCSEASDCLSIPKARVDFFVCVRGVCEPKMKRTSDGKCPKGWTSDNKMCTECSPEEDCSPCLHGETCGCVGSTVWKKWTCDDQNVLECPLGHGGCCEKEQFYSCEETGSCKCTYTKPTPEWVCSTGNPCSGKKLDVPTQSLTCETGGGCNRAEINALSVHCSGEACLTTPSIKASTTVTCKGVFACHQSPLSAKEILCDGQNACSAASLSPRTITADVLTCRGKRACFTMGQDTEGSITVGTLMCAGGKVTWTRKLVGEEACAQDTNVKSTKFKFTAKDIDCSNKGCRNAVLYVTSGGSVACRGHWACDNAKFHFEDADHIVTCENDGCNGCKKTVEGSGEMDCSKL